MKASFGVGAVVAAPAAPARGLARASAVAGTTQLGAALPNQMRAPYKVRMATGRIVR